MKNKNLLINCECHGEVLSLTRFENEEETYFTVYKYSYYSISFFRRIKLAIKVLKGEGISTADVVLSKENFDKIKEF